ncbi:MAG: hypothetical protein JO212_19935 [Acetobacteraceae bacterium]|nr:hypothetical protein [Acetobacteraceae bacterium]
MSDTDAGPAKVANDSGNATALERPFCGFPVPSGPFDASVASPALLRRYGLPPRPDPDAQPLLRQVWNRGFGAPLTLKEFRFVRADLVQQTRYQTYEIPVSETRVETSSNWSGAYITANRDKHFLQIWGVWTVPAHVRLPPAPFQKPGVEYKCATWIGLDGQRLYFDSSLPQIGTSSTLKVDGTTVAEAWTQWWARGIPNAQPQQLGLTVAPGNQVLAVLTAWDAQNVIFVMVNLSDSSAIGVKRAAPTVTLPDGTKATPDIAGATAEWIVERPAIPGQPLVHNRPPLYNFPDYGCIEFDLCVAIEGDSVDIFSLFGGLPQDLQGERLIRMFDVLHDPERTVFVSMPRRVDDTTLRLHHGCF